MFLLILLSTKNTAISKESACKKYLSESKLNPDKLKHNQEKNMILMNDLSGVCALKSDLSHLLHHPWATSLSFLFLSFSAIDINVHIKYSTE